jgi:glutamine synthetase-like protein
MHLPGADRVLVLAVGPAGRGHRPLAQADRELADVLGGYFVSSFLAYKRNEIERFERYVTDWEFREYAYHL